MKAIQRTETPETVFLLDETESDDSSCDESSIWLLCDGDRDDNLKHPYLNAPHYGVDKEGCNQSQLCKLIIGASGVYAAHMTYSIVQEDLFTFRTEDGTNFRNGIWLLQVLEATAGICLGIVGRNFLEGVRKSRFNMLADAHLFFFSSGSLSGATQVLAKAFACMALAAGLSYPVCMLAKSAKIIPVMMGQLLLGGSKYGSRDYLFAGLIVTGTGLLSLGSTSQSSSSASSNDTFWGVFFLVWSLCMDGLTGGLQKKFKSDLTQAGSPPTTYDLILYSHLSMACVSLVISILTGDLWEGIAFLNDHPVILCMVVELCLCSVVGTFFIFYVIANFDPLVCATVTTTRKIMSALVSVTFKGHQLTVYGFLGLGLAMCGLFLEVAGKAVTSQHHRTILQKESFDVENNKVEYT